MFVVVEMPKYKPPNPLWQSEYDGESINMIFACLVSEEFILNGGKEVIGVYDTCWCTRCVTSSTDHMMNRQARIHCEG